MKRLTRSLGIVTLAALTTLGLLTGVAEPSIAAADDPPVSTAEEDLRTQVIGDFETPDENWGFTRGPEFPGAKGGFSRQADEPYDGLFSARLRGNFSDGGTYVGLTKEIDLDLRGLSFWVRSSDASFLTLRLTDATGQHHQQRLAVTPDGAWQEIVVSDFDQGTGYNSWGGADDGVWHGPAQAIRLHLPKAALSGELTGDVFFDDITATVPPPDLEFVQAEPGNVFVGDDQPRIGIDSTADTVDWTVTDFWGAEVATGSAPVDGSAEVSLPVDVVGYYELDATAYRDGEPIATRETTFAKLSDYDFSAVDDSPFGMQVHYSMPRWQDFAADSLELVTHAGAKSIREGSWWAWQEPEPGVYDFTRPDMMMPNLRASGLDFLGTAQGYSTFYDNGATPYTSEGQQGFANHALSMVDEYYTDPMDWIQVFNEPNTAVFGDRKGVDGFDGDCDFTPECYFGILKTTYQTVKAEHPDLPVVSAGFVGVGRSPRVLPWLEDLFELGALDYMDVLAIHTYAAPDEPESGADQLAQLETLIREYNDGELIPIWVTENGYATHQTSTGVSEATQAAYVPQSHAVAFNGGVERYFYYELMNDVAEPDPTSHNNNYGLLHNTADPSGRWTPKAGYVSYAAMTRELTGAEFSHKEDGIGDGVSSYVFDRDDGQQTHLLWADEPTTIAVDTQDPVRLTNLMGETETLTPQADQVHVTVGENPVYLTGADLTMSESGLLTLTADPGVTGEDLHATLTIDNTGTPRAPRWGTFEVAGTTTNVHVPPGRKVDIPITIPAQNHAGDRELVGRLLQRTGRRGATSRLSATTTVVDALSMTSKHVLTPDGDDVLRVQVANVASSPREVGDIEWSVGGDSGTAPLASPIASGETASVDVPLADLDIGEHDYTVTIDSPDQGTLSAGGAINLVDHADLTPMTHQAITVDGILDDLSGAHTIDLAAEGTVEMDNYDGAADLSGDIAVTWDEDNLYLSASITDDTHTQESATSDDIWAGDSIQFAVEAGSPGEAGQWYEYGTALTDDGPKAHRWATVDGKVGEVTDADIAITRTGTTTTYEVALPWDSYLTPATPDQGLLSFSMLVNDNDGAGRKGWIEWGSGVGSRPKDSALFNPMMFEAARP
ncbi:sugar-binding protein [Phytoactinopolyspora endophytica]|uniref:sugar-binding protein n=1 Tax=Phytoactinopolyspora endophytica TaxID=1642495 RepID=UPI0013EA5FF2|nr:sugar-binding protein [Phytoactinopolyspora endophytica]